MKIGRSFLIRKIGKQADIAHIQLPSALDSMTAYQLLDQIDLLARKGFSKYIVNLEEVEYISSTGIEVMFRLQRELHEQYGEVLMTNIPEKIYTLFDKVGVMTILNATKSLEQAVENQSHREDVGSKRGLAHGLLRRHVADGTAAGALHRPARHQGDAEIGQPQRVVRKKNQVFRLDVAMDDP